MGLFGVCSLDSGFASLDSGFAPLVGTAQRRVPLHPVTCVASACLIIGSVYFDHWIKVVSARLLQHGVTLLSFVMNKYFVGSILRQCEYIPHHQILNIYLSVYLYQHELMNFCFSRSPMICNYHYLFW